MKISFFIIMLYAICGFLYYPSLYSFVALLFIFVSTIPIYIAGLNEPIIDIKASKPNIFMFIFVIFIGVVNLGIIANHAGYDFKDIFTIEGIKNIATQSTLIRYIIDPSAHSGNPILLAFSLWLVYQTARVKENVSKFQILLAWLPIIFYTVLTTEKWPTFLSGVFYFAGIFSASSFKESIKIIRQKSIYIVIILILMVVSLVLRGDDESVFTLIHKMLHYVFSSYYGLGYWLVEKYHNIDLTLGILTFSGPLSYIADIKRDAGVYANSYYIYDMVSNIYTAFRYVIEDFSIIGPLVINIFLAILYKYSIKRNLIKLTLSIRILLIFIALLSLNVTPFVHNSVLLAIILSILSTLLPKITLKKENINEQNRIYSL